MPWKEVSTMSQRHEFMLLAQQPGVSLRALCRRFEISPTTAYKWLARYATEGRTGLADHSRRPHQMPQRTPTALEAAVLQLRTQHPTWGGRKLHARLQAWAMPRCRPRAPSPRFSAAPRGSPPSRPPPSGRGSASSTSPQCLVANGFQKAISPWPTAAATP